MINYQTHLIIITPSGLPYWRVKAARGRSWKRALGAHRTNCPPERCWYWQFRPFAVGYGKSFQKDKKKKTRGPHESLERNYALMCVERSSDMFFTQWMCWVSVFSSLFCFFTRFICHILLRLVTTTGTTVVYTFPTIVSNLVFLRYGCYSVSSLLF